jgi:pyridoxamine 5'-phosphate oxidase
VTERIDYRGEGLTPEQVPAEPWPLVRAWVDLAEERQREHGDLREPHLITIATVDADGMPDARGVLMRFLDPRGPGFVSSTSSAKAAHLEANPVMAGVLTWMPLFRAIRFRGRAERIAAEEVDRYWTERPWGSQIGAWASRQSHPVASRGELEAAFDRYAVRWPEDGSAGPVPPPEDWAGWRIDCTSVEFWAGRASRLHDRVKFTRVAEGGLDTVGAWESVRLQP